MVDIDERVVQMKFDSSDFEQKSKNTLSILDKLHQKLSFKDANNNDNLNAITDNVEKMANKAYTIVDRMIDKIKDNIANKLVGFLQENTVGQLQKGWSKYADMTTSVATLKSQGYAMEKITEQLERLNYFTDETSYNFTDMVREIGKFTASGQSLEDATTAMMGIAEWASLSGKNANDASRAMYQLSQALGAGQMRLQDYKSVQNLNMDTIEFRKNAIEAALAVGTLKDNLDGTYTSLLNNKITFSIQNFTESLTQGKWFNSEVMMATYKKYSAAVDEIRAIVEEGQFTNVEGVTSTFQTTADALKEVKKNNDLLTEKFRKVNEKLTKDEIDNYLKRWKKVVKVTDEAVDNYAEINKMTKEQAQKEMTENYAQYLKEYAEVFKDTEKTAEEALDDWHTYVSSYGVKAFTASQEAKTFVEAIESAKDAASTVWVGIYQDIFGDYEEAKALWTDLANQLYEIFVTRLSSVKDIFDYWKSGYEEDKQKEIDALKKEFKELSSKTSLSDYEQQRMNAIMKQLDTMEKRMKAGLYDGRRVFFQGVYAFGSGFTEALFAFRDAWDGLFAENESGKKLFSFSEKLRINGFQFYTMIQNLIKTDFFKNMAQGIRNLFAPLKAVVEIIRNVIGQFLPKGQTVEETLVNISQAFVDLTAKLVPSRDTITKIAKILRGVVAVIKLIAKVAYGFWKSVLSPILSAAWEFLSAIIDIVLDIGAAIGDALFAFEESIGPMEALASVGGVLKDVLLGIVYVLATIVREITKFVAPVFRVLKNTIEDVINKIKGLIKSDGKGGNIFTNIADGFSDMADRAKKAWHEGETLADVFNRFKGGTGIGNFLQMLGAMFDNLITRIGKTIVAILGLDEELAKTKIGEGIQTAKDIIVQAFAILKWLYTNVIKPVFSLFFEGIKNSLKEVGEAFRSGDINYFLDTLKRLFGTISSMEIVKLIRMLLRVLGSGGLLKIFKNGAKALQGIYKYFSAKATNEMSSAFIKMALALTIVVGAMTALTFLPQDKLEKLGGLLLGAAIAMGGMIVGLIGMGAVMKLMDNPLRGITAMFWSMTIAMLTTILAIRGMEKAFGDLWTVTQKGTDAQGNPIYSRRFNWDAMLELAGAALAPVLAVFGVLLGISWLAKKLNAGSTLKTFAYSVAGLGIGIAALALGFRTLIQVIRDSKPEEAAAAVKIIIVLLAVLTLAGIALSRFSGTMNGWKSGLGVAIAMAGMMLTISLIVIPCLDDMVKNRDKFPQYLEALSIFAFTMLSISASLWLMTVGTKGGLHILAAGLVFNNMTRVISKMLLPMLQTIQTIDFASALSGVATIGLLVLSLSGAIRLILDGLANIITSVSKINWKSWAAIIISTGLMVALIIGMINLFEMAGIELSAGSILAPLAIVAGICLTFGIFVKSISKTLGSGDKMRENVIKVFTSILLMLTVVSAGIIGIIAATGVFFKGNTETALLTIAAFALSVTLILVTLTSQFAKLVSSLSGTIKDISKTEFERVMQVISIMMKFMALIMGGFLLNTIGVGLTYSNPTASLAPILGLFVSLLIFLPTMKAVLLNLFDDILEITKDINEKKLDQIIETLKVMLTSIAAIVGVIGLAVVGVGITYDNGSEWQSIIASIGIVIAVIGSIYAASKAFDIIGKMVKDKAFTDAVFKKFNTVVIIMAGYISLITGVLTVAINSMSDRIGINFANAVIIVGTILVTTLAMSKMFSSLLNNIDSKDFSRNSLIALGLSLATMIAITYEVSGFFQKIHDYEVLDWTTGLSFAISMGGYLVALGYAMQMILRAVNVMPMNSQAANVVALSMLGMIGVVAASAALVSQLNNLAGVDWTTALAALGGIAIIMLTLSRIIDTLVMTSAMPMNLTNILGGIAVMFGGLASIALLAPGIFSAFKELEGVSWTTVAQGLIITLGPFLLLFEIVKSMSFGGLGDAFVVTAFKIAAGIAVITLALYALTQVGFLIKELFGLGERAGEAVQDGFESKEGIHSPSKEFAKDGKYLVQGLAQGIKKNQKIAGKAASNLGNYTNDSFCDTLGIASPSKVFYENGRFVVRGFINGVNSEANKNKQAGADMASGFGEGLDSIMEENGEKWKGIFSEFGKDIDIGEAMKEGLGDLPGIFEDSIFGPTAEALTDAEEEELKSLEEKYARLGSNLSEVDSKRLVELQGKKAKAGKNKLTGDFMDTFTSSFTGALGSNDVIEAVTGGLSGIKDKALEWIGSNETIKTITDVFTGEGKVVDQVGDDIEKKLAGKDGTISKVIDKITGDSGILSSAAALGSKIGSAITGALASVVYQNPLSKGIAWVGYKLGIIDEDVYHVIAGDAEEINRKKMNNSTNRTTASELILEYSNRSYGGREKLSEDIKNKKDRIYSINMELQGNPYLSSEKRQSLQSERNILQDQVTELEKQYNELEANVTDWNTVNLLLLDTLIDGEEMSKDQVESNLLRILSDPDKNNKIIGEHTSDEIMEKLKDRFVKEDYDYIMANSASDDHALNYLNDIINSAIGAGYVSLDEHGLKVKAGTEEELVDYITSAYFSGYDYVGRTLIDQEQKRQKRFRQAIEQSGKKNENEYLKNRTMANIENLDFEDSAALLQTKFKTDLYQNGFVGEMMGRGIIEGFARVLSDGTVEIIPETLDEFIKFIKDYYKIKSPSRVFADEVGFYIGEGVGVGFEESVPSVLKMIDGSTDIISDEAITAFRAMINSLDDETIQPTIAPIYDSSTFTNGVSMINDTFSGLTDRADATSRSFITDTPNYNGPLATLSKQVNALTGVVSSFMSMVETGDIVNVNIETELNDDAIYDNIIRINRQRFKASGKNGFMI